MSDKSILSAPKCVHCNEKLTLAGNCGPYKQKDLPDWAEPGSFYICPACGLGQRLPQPDPSHLRELYAANSGEKMQYTFEDNAAWYEARELLLGEYPTDQEISILDIGCYTGLFLSGLPPAWRRHGVEVESESRRVAEQRHGVQMIAERIEELDPGDGGRFDVVTLFDVLEHLTNPADGLRRAMGSVRPGGMLVLSTGDRERWTWNLLGSGHWYLQTPEHLTVASRGFVQTTLLKAGAKDIEFKSIPHRRGSLGTRVNESLKLLHWSCMCRGGIWRLPQRIIQSLPGCRHFRHAVGIPWTMHLRDHMMVCGRL